AGPSGSTEATRYAGPSWTAPRPTSGSGGSTTPISAESTDPAARRPSGRGRGHAVLERDQFRLVVALVARDPVRQPHERARLDRQRLPAVRARRVEGVDHVLAREAAIREVRTDPEHEQHPRDVRGDEEYDRRRDERLHEDHHGAR